MPEPAEIDGFERRLADELARHAAIARDPRPTALVAAEAIRRAGDGGRRFAVWPRRMLLGLAAILLLPLALLAATALREEPPTEAWLAVVVRPVAGAEDGSADILVVNTDRTDRRLRRLEPAHLEWLAGSSIDGWGGISSRGWLNVLVTDPNPGGGDRPRWASLQPAWLHALIDLADPAQPPVIASANAAVGGRWSPTGLFATPCRDQWDNCLDPETAGAVGPITRVRVVDPPSPFTRSWTYAELFGGGPEIVWAADGSGFVASRDLALVVERAAAGGDPWDPTDPSYVPEDWGVMRLDGTYVSGFPALASRTMTTGGRMLRVDGTTAFIPQPGGSATIALRFPEELPARPIQAAYAADDTSAWVLMRAEGPVAAVLAHVDGSGAPTVVWTIEGLTPSGLTLSPDDSVAAIGKEEGDGFFLVRTDSAGGDTSPALVEGTLLGFVPAAEAEGWLR